MIEPELLSHLIGLIYDCAIDPDRWPETLAEICRAIGCMSGGILLIDRKNARHRFAYSWGMPNALSERYFATHSNLLTGFYNRLFTKDKYRDGQPVLVSQIIDAIGQHARNVYDEWAKPQGVADVMQTVVMRDRERLGIFCANRHSGHSMLGEPELASVRLLVPHIRRAVTITDILDVHKLEARTLAATLDNFSSGVVVVGDSGRILHANGAARRMIETRSPVTSVGGFLSIRNAEASDELSHAIALAQANESSIGASGIGIALQSERPAVAHVLPLAYGNLRTRLVPQATAAVFITQSEESAAPDITAIARSFSLTPAETRILGYLVRGDTLADAAEALGVSLTTARTHLAHIFSKTETARQADLIALVSRLMPPVSSPKE